MGREWGRSAFGAGGRSRGHGQGGLGAHPCRGRGGGGTRRACRDQKVRRRRRAVVLTCRARVPILSSNLVGRRSSGAGYAEGGLEAIQVEVRKPLIMGSNKA